MYRRRHQPREVQFSFDSFLDLVANVVGIIIRLILVVWVGARSYSSLTRPAPVPEAPAHVEPEPDYSTEAEQQAIAQLQRDLAGAEEALLARLQEQQPLRSREKSLTDLARAERERRHLLEQQGQDLLAQARKKSASAEQLQARMQDLQARSQQLREQINQSAKQRSPRKVFHYQTPVAEIVQSEEMHFEVQAGRVSFLDVDAFLREIKRKLNDHGQKLRNQWEVEARTEPVGAFRMRYLVVRERPVAGGLASPAGPAPDGNFSYGVEGWEAEALDPQRGEASEAALLAESQFRRLIDRLDPGVTAVTFWVYPDSFPAYRALRDYCVKRGILVAGRPLPTGQPISGSRRGTASQGQ